MSRSIDKDPLYQNLLLGLPFSEGTGTVLTQDVAKPHHPITLSGSPVWTQLASGLWVLDFVPNDYLQCLAASCTDLDFLTASFSGAVWVYPDAVDNRAVFSHYTSAGPTGWIVWLGAAATQLAASAPCADAPALTTGVWTLLGFSRVASSTYSRILFNGIDVTTSTTSRAITTAAGTNLTIGCRSDAALMFDGKMWNPRIWGRFLTPWEHRQIFNRERHLFGV